MDGITNFRRRDAVERRVEPPVVEVPVDFDDLAERLAAIPPSKRPFHEFAPPAQRPPEIEVAVRTIASFGALPTTEIDAAIATAKAELAEIEGLAQKVRDVYVLVTDDLLKRVAHLRAIQKIAAETFATLTERCEALDAAPAADPPQEEPA